MKIGAVALILLLSPALAFAEAKLYLSPSRASYVVGETFDVHVLADTAGTSVNAAEAELSYDPESLAVESVSTQNSILATFSTEPNFSNGRGTVSFSGWTAAPYAGSDGLLLTIRFKALRTVMSRASLVAGAILAVDQSSNIIESMESGLYAVEPERVEQPLPDETATSTEDAESIAVMPATPELETVPPIEAGERFAVHGRAEPDTRIWIRVVGPSMEGETAVWSDENGAFTYTSGEIARDGIYRVVAAAESREGLRSEPSERIIVEVQPTGIMSSAAAAAGFMRFALPFLAFLLGSAVLAGYLMHRARA